MHYKSSDHRFSGWERSTPRSTLICKSGSSRRSTPDRGFILPADEAERIREIIVGSRVVEIPGTNHYTITLSEVFTRVVLAHLSAGE